LWLPPAVERHHEECTRQTMSLAIDSVGLSQLLAAAVVGSRTRCVRGDTEGCDRLASLARWVQQEDERTSDDALQAGWAGRVRPD
jgi:hypothetical protein